jgi:hypothetical protein
VERENLIVTDAPLLRVAITGLVTDIFWYIGNESLITVALSELSGPDADVAASSRNWVKPYPAKISIPPRIGATLFG